MPDNDLPLPDDSDVIAWIDTHPDREPDGLWRAMKVLAILIVAAIVIPVTLTVLGVMS